MCNERQRRFSARLNDVIDTQSLTPIDNILTVLVGLPIRNPSAVSIMIKRFLDHMLARPCLIRPENHTHVKALPRCILRMTRCQRFPTASAGSLPSFGQEQRDTHS